MRKLVNQSEDFDCVVASLAMYAQIEYSTAFILCMEEGWRPDAAPGGIGVPWIVLRKVLIRQGFRPIRTHQWTDHCGILTVPSLNDRGGTHAVYTEGYRILDPQSGRPGKRWYGPDEKPSWCQFVMDARCEDAAFMARFEMKENMEMLK